MYPKQVLYIIAVVIISTCCHAAREYYLRCNFNGFTCIIANVTTTHLVYQCPAAKPDVTIHIWEFSAPTNIRSFSISNCITLRLYFGCANQNRPIGRLVVENITNLYINPSVLTHNPPEIIFKNIGHLEYIPTTTFSQIKLKTFKPGCFIPAVDLHSLYFENVNIGIIESKAFDSLKNIEKFIWKNVTVKRLQNRAIEINLNNFGNFSISNSTLEIFEHLAFQLKGNGVSFSNNTFTELAPSAINGTFENFVFVNNSVNSILPFGISILATNIFIKQNNFLYVSANAFDNISPGLLQNSQTNFGKLRFLYEFSENTIHFIEAGGLNPDIDAYGNVATDLKVIKNSIYCNCENLGWLFMDVGHGYNTELLRDFYETIMAREYENDCMFTTCKLPIVEAYKLLKDGKCVENMTPENLCSKPAKIQIISTSGKPQINLTSRYKSDLSRKLSKYEKLPQIQNCTPLLKIVDIHIVILIIVIINVFV